MTSDPYSNKVVNRLKFYRVFSDSFLSLGHRLTGMAALLKYVSSHGNRFEVSYYKNFFN